MTSQENGRDVSLASAEPECYGVSAEEVRTELQRIQGSLKEYQVGVVVCGRSESYDTRTDPVVRVEARRLRSALDTYYANEGREDAVIIGLPKGGYVPCFSVRQALPKPPATGIQARRKWQIIAAVAAISIMLAASLFYSRHHAKPLLTDKDTVVLADFVNSTGDTVFDDTLRHGLSAQLEQSPFLNLLSDTRVAQTLALMGQTKDARITGELARQICERTGSTATIEGSISRLGGEYVLSLKAVNCHDGDLLAEEQLAANGKEQVLTVLGTAATKLREKLGESLASVQKFDAPPENVTTPSLEALQAYSFGFKVHVINLDEAGAAALFQRAVTLDPHFAMAYARLATCYVNLGESSRATESMIKAYELRNGVSEHERLFILSLYHEFVTGDLEEARKTYELRAQIYPHDDIPIGNLGNLYFSLGKYDKALAVTEEALRRNPGSRIWYGNFRMPLESRTTRLSHRRTCASSCRRISSNSSGLQAASSTGGSKIIGRAIPTTSGATIWAESPITARPRMPNSAAKRSSVDDRDVSVASRARLRNRPVPEIPASK